jgi:LysR family carnitine catabolism transcriptional activator
VALNGPQVERRVGLLRLAEHKLSTAAQALADIVIEVSSSPARASR